MASYKAVMHDDFREDLAYWTKTRPKTAIKILKLIDIVLRTPFEGQGKPEKLRHLSENTWSRRIDQEHRLLYKICEDYIHFIQARYHY